MPSDQQPASAPPTQESVVEFGTTPDEPAHSSRPRWNVSGLVAGLAGDHRVVPLAAVLGAVALFASLVSEWQVTLFDTTAVGGTLAGLQPVPTDVADLGSWGAGYLVGLFLLVSATVLTLFGPPQGRRYARLAGISAGGLLLALLVALVPTLDDTSRTLGYLVRYQFDTSQLQMAGGRGVWCAIAGVVLVTLALVLAGRHLDPPVSDDPADEAAEEVPRQPEAIWSWRRPQPIEEDRLPDEPFDLTVTSTNPFTPLLDDRDKPS